MRDKVFNIVNNSKYDGYQRVLASMVYKCFYKKKISAGAATLALSEILATQNKSDVRNENVSNNVLDEELYKPIIRKV